MSSKIPRAKPYNHDELNKKIIARPPKVYPENEMIGPYGRYRDQNQAIYVEQKAQFLDTINEYRKNNEMALIRNRVRLGRFSDDSLKYPFEKTTEEVSLYLIELDC